jgi:hypothetical protein
MRQILVLLLWFGLVVGAANGQFSEVFGGGGKVLERDEPLCKLEIPDGFVEIYGEVPGYQGCESNPVAVNYFSKVKRWVGVSDPRYQVFRVEVRDLYESYGLGLPLVHEVFRGRDRVKRVVAFPFQTRSDVFTYREYPEYTAKVSPANVIAGFQIRQTQLGECVPDPHPVFPQTLEEKRKENCDVDVE